MNDLRATESEPKRRRMSVADELLLAMLPTGIVLTVIALIESLGWGLPLAIGPVFVPSGNFSGALHGGKGRNLASCNYVCVFRQAFTGPRRYASCVGSGELARLRTGGGT
jgi:hypothetical protein